MNKSDLITSGYLGLNVELHTREGKWGDSGHTYIKTMKPFLGLFKPPRSILDYGCGEGSIKNHLSKFNVHEYDPAIDGKDSLPNPADLVICTDVMEHIEPLCLDNVIDHIYSLTKYGAFIAISTRLANRTLANGQNAHLIVQNAEWWKKKFSTYPWKIKDIEIHHARYSFLAAKDEWKQFSSLQVAPA